jgi:hypothetical protein
MRKNSPVEKILKDMSHTMTQLAMDVVEQPLDSRLTILETAETCTDGIPRQTLNEEDRLNG